MKKRFIASSVMAVVLAFGAAASALAGAVAGPSIHKDAVDAYDTDLYKVKFWGGVSARVAVSGDGDTDLDLYVLDQSGNIVAMDEGPSDDCFVRWMPQRTSVYTIKVVNRGRVYNEYAIGTD